MPTSWKVCLDDTCDELRKDFICVGALMGQREGWNQFNKEWRKALKRDPAIDYFHGKDLPKLRGSFLKFRDQRLFPKPTGMDAAVAKRKELQKVIEDSSLVGLGIGVLLPEYNHIRETHPRGKTFMAKDAFEYILQNLYIELLRPLQRSIRRRGYHSSQINQIDRPYTSSFTISGSNRTRTRRSLCWRSHTKMISNILDRKARIWLRVPRTGSADHL